MKAPLWLATRLPTPRSGPMAGLETAWQVFRATSVWLDTEPGRTVPDWSWPTLSCSYTRYGQYKFTLPFFFYNILNNLYNCSFRHGLLLVIVCNEYNMLERQITIPIIQNSYQCSFRSWNSMLYTEHFNSSIIKSNLHWCTDWHRTYTCKFQLFRSSGTTGFCPSSHYTFTFSQLYVHHSHPDQVHSCNMICANRILILMWSLVMEIQILHYT